MKSFAPRSQRDRTFDKLVQSGNHSTLLQRSVPICKSSASKSTVLQRPVSPRKSVIVTSFTGDDDGDYFDDEHYSTSVSPDRLPSSKFKHVQETAVNAPATCSESFDSKIKKATSSSSHVSISSSTSSRDVLPTAKTKIPTNSEKEPPRLTPLRVTFRVSKCPSSTSCQTASIAPPKAAIVTSTSSLSSGVRATYSVQSKSSTSLTLSFKRQLDPVTEPSVTYSENATTALSDEVSVPKLSSPPLIKSQCSKPSSSRESLSPSQGVKRKTAVENYECEQLHAFVSGIEERALSKRRMLQPPSNASSSSSDVSTSSIPDKCVSSNNKSRTLLTQKILMTKSASAPSEPAGIDQSMATTKRHSLLKKSSSLAVNRKAVYNPRQWIGDVDDEPRTSGTAKPEVVKSKPIPNSTFDFDSDEESGKSGESLPTQSVPPISRQVPPQRQRKEQPEATTALASSCASRQAPASRLNPTRSANVNSLSKEAVPSRPLSRPDQDTKALYTVVRNVKEAHECQESGETQDLLDDVEYMLDGLKSTESPATRCLSLLRLCKECLVHSFRMTLKAHGLLPRIFAHVMDAPNDGSDRGVALHVAALLFILSRDKLAAGDLDKEGLRLLLLLLRCDGKGLSVLQSHELDRTRSRLRPVIEQVTKLNASKTTTSIAQRLHVTCFTAKDLAVESLLNLSVRKASDWFKNELRMEGGLDHFCQATIDAMDYFNNELETQDLTEFMLDRLRRIEQYMRLLENMTYMNGANQEYLVHFEQRSFLDSIAACLRLCVNNLPRSSQPDSPVIKVLVACLLAIWRVLLNISHDNEKCSDRLGAHPLLIPLSLHCILRLPQRLPVHRRFDMLVLTLGFLVNLVEHCDENRARLAHTQVRLPWRRPKSKRQHRRRGLVLNPSVRPDSPSSSSDDYDGSDSSSSDDEDCPKSKTALEALVNLFLERYQASEQHELEQQEESTVEENGKEEESQAKANANDDKAADQEGGDDDGMKWRLIEDKQLERQRRGRHRPFHLIGRKGDGDGDSDEEMADDSDSDSGADVEFMPSTQEQSAALESALSRAGEHMEASMTASYVALLLGCMMRGSRRRVDRVQGRLPEGRFKPLAMSLAKFLGFMSLTSAVGQAGGKSMLEVVHFLHELDENGEIGVRVEQSSQSQSNERDSDKLPFVCASSAPDSRSSS